MFIFSFLCRKIFILLLFVQLLSYLASAQLNEKQKSLVFQKITPTLRKEVMQKAQWALQQAPVTVTAERCERSAGGLHDFYSEGDYWWPNPADPNGPYLQRDGQTNPQNFVAHRRAMVRLSQIVGALGSAYQLTHQEKYAKHAFKHLRAWFVDEATRMNPSLLYAQAIKGRFTGRGIGIIDMIQMIEVAQGIRVMAAAKSVNPAELQAIKQWFEQYLTWVNTHPYGIDEREAKNNHGTCWVMQVAVFATLVENDTLLSYCRNRYKTVLLPQQMADNGGFTLELKRTKPYAYSLFNLDAMTTLCHVLSTPTDDLWVYNTPTGQNMKKGVDFMYPFVENKAIWPYPNDIMYFEEWPVAHPFLLFAYQKFGHEKWLETWQKLPHFPTTEETIRNLPVRYPLLWLEPK